MALRLKSSVSRYFCIILTLLVLVSVFSIQSFALSESVVPDASSSKVIPLADASYFVSLGGDIYTPLDSIAAQGNLASVLLNNSTNRLISEAHVFGSGGETVLSHAGYAKSNVVVDGVPMYRIYESFDFAPVGDYCYNIESFTVQLKPFSGEWNINEIGRAFWMHGSYDFYFSCNIWVITDNGLVMKKFSQTGSCNGDQSPLYNSVLLKFVSDYGIHPGDSYMVTDFVCTMFPTGVDKTLVRVSRWAETVSQLVNDVEGERQYINWPPDMYDVFDFVREATDAPLFTPPTNSGSSGSSGSGGSTVILSTSFTEFFRDIAVGFFDAELTPGLSLGGIFLIVVIFAVVIGIIKLLL